MKVAVDGMTAPAPAGIYFPEMVMNAHMLPGQANFVMDMEVIYLPRLQESILQSVDASQMTMIVADEASAPDLTAQERSYLSVEVPAGSLVAEDGSPMAAGQVGVSTVPAELVRDMLPPGILQHTFDITVQAPGISNFSTPAPLTIPNKLGADPGTQINLLSFDHTTGLLVIEGTMTVSADGQSISTDPDVGITHPGWHGGTPPGVQISMQSEPVKEGDELPTVSATGNSKLLFANESTSIVVTNNGSAGKHKNATVTLEFTGVQPFVPGLPGKIVVPLPPGGSELITLTARGIEKADLERMDKDGVEGELFSGNVRITATSGGESVEVNSSSEEKYYYAQYFSIFEEIGRSELLFAPTNDDTERVQTIRLTGQDETPIEVNLTAGKPNFSAEKSGDKKTVSFNPVSGSAPQFITGDLDLIDPDNKFLGLIALEGSHRPNTKVFVNKPELENVFEQLDRRLDGAGLGLASDRTTLAEMVESEIETKFRDVGGVEIVTSVGPNTVSVNYGLSLEVNSTEDTADSNVFDRRCDTGKTVKVNDRLVPECTLRAALLQANHFVGAVNLISFGIPQSDTGYSASTGQFTISPESALPRIFNPINIDGTTQNEFSHDKLPVIVISGKNAGDGSTDGTTGPGVDGLVLFAGESTISGLVINDFKGNGIRITGEDAAGNHIHGNYLGVVSEADSGGNKQAGILLTDGARENTIGTNGDGDSDRQEANVIGGNKTGGIRIEGAETAINFVAGNYIGTDNKNEELPNGYAGTIDGVGEYSDYNETIELVHADFDVFPDLVGRIITITSGESIGSSRRILSHELETIKVDSFFLEPDPIIGFVSLGGVHRTTNPTTGDFFFLRGDGVTIEDSNSNLIGGSGEHSGNTIAFNLGAGVAVDGDGEKTGLGNLVLSNSIYENDGVGIDLVVTVPTTSNRLREPLFGFTNNDNAVFDPKRPGTNSRLIAFDTDVGPNGLLNFPELSIKPSTTSIQGTLHTDQEGSYLIQFFSSQTGDKDEQGFQEGREFIDEMIVRAEWATDLAGALLSGGSKYYATFNAPSTVKSSLGAITATATALTTEGGGTSEFSAPAQSRSRGVTVLTHGGQARVSDGDGLAYMGEAILNRTGGTLVDYDEFLNPEPLGNTFLMTGFEEVWVPPVATPFSGAPDAATQERVMVYEWAEDSFLLSDGWAEHAADAMFAILIGKKWLNVNNPNDNVPFHFIGHSFGAAVNSEVVERMVAHDVAVQHVTYLDPHDFDQGGGLPVDGSQAQFKVGRPQFKDNSSGFGATVWETVEFVDVYYQVRGANAGAPVLPSFLTVPNGRPIPGAYNRFFAGGIELPSLQYRPYQDPPGSPAGDHSWIHNVFYLSTIEGTIRQDLLGRLEVLRPTDRSFESEFTTTGYAFGRNALIQVPEKDRPAPTYFNNDPAEQDHFYSPEVLVDASGGLKSGGLAQLELQSGESIPNANALTNVAWKTQVTELEIFNGDFQQGPQTATSIINFEVPGWRFHGGGGSGFTKRLLFDDNQFLRLDSNTIHTHNLLYFPNTPGLELVFDTRISVEQPTSRLSSVLEVAMDDRILVSFGFPEVSNIFLTKRVPVPPDLLGKVSTFTFGTPDGIIDIDNVRFEAPTAPGGGEGEVAEQQATIVADTQTTRPIAQGAEIATTFQSSSASTGPFGLLGDSSPTGQLIDTAVQGDGVDNAASIRSAIETGNSLVTRAAKNYLLASSLNTSLRSNVIVYVGNHITDPSTLTADKLKNAIVTTAVHEIAHTLGAFNSGFVGLDDDGEQIILEAIAGSVSEDMMLAGSIDLDGDQSFQANLSKEIVAMGLGAAWSLEDGTAAREAFTDHLKVSGPNAFDTTNGDDPTNDGPVVVGPFLQLLGPDARQLISGTIDLGIVVADGPGQAAEQFTLTLANLGSRDVIIDSVRVVDPTGSFSVEDIPAATVLPSGGLSSGGIELPVEVTFDPTTATGQIDAVLQIFTNEIESPREVSLRGVGLSPAGDIRLEVNNNNAGGYEIGAGTKTVPGFATLKNIGSDNLTITDLVVSDLGNQQFTLAGLPMNLGPANPMVLAPGASADLDLRFQPDTRGLRLGEFQVISDDPDSSILLQRLVGTGLGAGPSAAHVGNDYFALDNPYLPSPPLRQVTDPGGNFDLFVAADTFYHATAFDPVSGLIADAYGTTPQSGRAKSIDLSNYSASTASDSDGDGLPDDIEAAIGTDPFRVDTNDDGISDLAAIQQGLAPLQGVAMPTGIVAAVGLQSESMSVEVQASGPDLEDRTAYVATGQYGLAIVDVSQFDAPVVLSEIDINGEARDVAVDTDRQLAVVASGPAGLTWIDVSDPMRPTQLSVNFDAADASHVELFEGVVHTARGSSLSAIDLVTGEILETHSPGGARITGLAREGSTLVSHDAARVLRTFDVSAGTLRELGALTLPDGGGAVFVGGGIAYVTEPNTLAGGFATVDVSDPESPTLLGRSNSQGNVGFPRTKAVSNGADTTVVIGDLSGVGLGQVLQTFDGSDPADNERFLTSFDVATISNDIQIAGGIAFVAAGAGGLQVLNYLSFDNQGQPPTVTLSSPIADSDTQAPGAQVVEGTTIPLNVDVDDDVQITEVELLVNGEVVSTDISFPFELSTVALSNNGSDLRIQARATDSGGNAGISNDIFLELVPDTVAPSIVSISPADASSSGQGVRRVQIGFDEPIAMAAANSLSVVLRDGDGQVVSPLDVALREGDRVIQLSYEPLGPGDYKIQIDAAIVTDRAGNPLGSGIIESDFNLADFTVQWVGADGFWDDPANWSTGAVPTDSDVALIDVPGAVTVTHRNVFGASSTRIAGIVSRESMFILGGSLTVDGAASYSSVKLDTGGTLTLNGNSDINVLELDRQIGSPLGGSLVVNDRLTIIDTSTWGAGRIGGVGQVQVDGLLNITGLGIGNPNLDAVMNVSGTIVDSTTINQSLFSIGFVLGDNGVLNILESGRYEIRDNARIDGGIINVAGIFTKVAGDGATDVRAVLNNTGTVDIQTGVVSLLSGGTGTDAVYNIAADGQLVMSGGGVIGTFGQAVLDGNTSITGAGSFVVDVRGGVELTIPAGANVTSNLQGTTLELTRGVLNLDGTLTNLGEANWHATFVRGTGTFVNEGDLTILGTGGARLEAVLDNLGSITQAGTFDLNLANGGTLNNATAAIYEVTTKAGLKSSILDNSTSLNNDGLIRKSGEEIATLFNLPVNNRGTIEVQVGDLLLNRGGVNTDASYVISAGASLRLTSGTHEFSGITSAAGAGPLVLLSNTVVNASGTVTFDSTVSSLEIDGGTFNAIGTVTTMGSSFWRGGTITGELINTGTLEIEGRFFRALRDATLINRGIVNHTASGRIDFLNSTIENEVGAVYEWNAASALVSQFGSLVHAFNNHGTFRKIGGDPTAIRVDFENRGVAEFLSGLVSFDRDFVQVTGTTRLDDAELGGNRTFDIQGGDFVGSGTVSGNLVNGGNLIPGDVGQAGTIDVTLTYTQTSMGTLAIELGGTEVGQSDRLLTNTGPGNRNATLEGILEVSLINAFSPVAGDSFEIIQFDSFSGGFAATTGLDLGGGLVLQEQVGTNSYTIAAMLALGLAGNGGDAALATERLNVKDIETVFDATIDRLVLAGLSWEVAGRLRQTDIQIVDLAGNRLGLAGGNKILLDSTAAGMGWFVDQTPQDDGEFRQSGKQLSAVTGGAAAGHVDLLTVLEHELLHLLGAGHGGADGDLLFHELGVGVRTPLSEIALDEIFGNDKW